jgi:hypothetical protein
MTPDTTPGTCSTPAPEPPGAPHRPALRALLDLVVAHPCYIGRGAILSACTPVERAHLAAMYAVLMGCSMTDAHDRMWLWIVGWRGWRVKLKGYAL